MIVPRDRCARDASSRASRWFHSRARRRTDAWPFCVEDGRCISGGAPEAAASSLMAHDEGPPHCFLQEAARGAVATLLSGGAASAVSQDLPSIGSCLLVSAAICSFVATVAAALCKVQVESRLPLLQKFAARLEGLVHLG